MDSRLGIVITCEHASNRVPWQYRELFVGKERLLTSHRGYDVGARELARRLSTGLRAPLLCGGCTRLLIDLNRSLHNRAVFSFLTRKLSYEEKAEIVRRYYAPFRQRVVAMIREALRLHACVVHLSVHSFTPVLAGRIRTADIGLLYDPARGSEARFCGAWQKRLHELDPSLRVRRNSPYRGTDDGLTTHLRKIFSPSRYLGLELEVNQRLPRGDRTAWLGIQRGVTESLPQSARG